MSDARKQVAALSACKRRRDKDESERKKRMKAGKDGSRKRARWR